MTPYQLFAQLDLTNSQDLLIAFHHFRHWPALVQMDQEQASRDLRIIDFYRPLIFGVADTPMADELVKGFLWDLGGEQNEGDTFCRSLATRSWLCIFREAFRRGIIGPIAFGSAIRFLLILTGGNGAPGEPADGLAARRIMLNDARRADPTSLMTAAERAALAALPDMVALWRGGSYGESETLFEQAQSLHWALDRDYAMQYMRDRNAVRTACAIHSRAPDQLGSGFLLRAEVPRELLLAYVTAANPFCRDVEVWLDFERLQPEMVQNVTPARRRLAAQKSANYFRGDLGGSLSRPHIEVGTIPW